MTRNESHVSSVESIVGSVVALYVGDIKLKSNVEVFLRQDVNIAMNWVGIYRFSEK